MSQVKGDRFFPALPISLAFSAPLLSCSPISPVALYSGVWASAQLLKVNIMTIMISDSIQIIETDNSVTIIVDNQHFFNYSVSAKNPRRSDEFYALDAISRCN